MTLKEVKLGDLKTGDQIAVRGNVEDLHFSLVALTVYIGDTYLHHGIYSKEDCSVIEFHGDNKENARPKKRDFTECFAGHDKLYRVEYEDGECLPVNETMQRANAAVEQGNYWPPYNLIKNNCESFATLIKTGVAKSRQVLEALLNTAMASVVAGPVVLITASSVGVSVISGRYGNKRK